MGKGGSVLHEWIFGDPGTILLVLAVLVAAGCSPNTSSKTATTAPSHPVAHPLSVQTELDTAHIVSAVLGPDGGQAVNGAFTLDVPAGALLSSHSLMLVPIQSVKGLPLSGGLLAGVDLQPEGLLLAKPATLTIKLSARPSGGLQVFGFGYRASGSELYLQPAHGSGTTVTVQVWHFSGAGLGAGTPADAQSQAANHPPSDRIDQVLQAEAAYASVSALLAAVQGQLLGDVRAAAADPAVLDALAWQAMTLMSLALAAGRPDLIGLLGTTLATVLLQAAQAAYSRCVAEHEPRHGMRILRWIKWAANHPEFPLAPNVSPMQDLALKCLHFQLDFTTVIDATFSPEAIHLAAEVKNLQLNPVPGSPISFVPAQSDVAYTDYKWTVPGNIPYTFTPSQIRQFSVQELRLDLDLFLAPEMIVDFGQTKETLTITVPNVPPVVLPLESFYTNGLETMNHDYMSGNHLFSIRDWMPAGAGPVWQRATHVCPCPQGPGAPLLSLDQHTVFELRHTPQN